ncbi:MAG: HAMP domain-containing sensor histidine kinase, partial [Deltaproteobacteria bacterium]|nr:HAMP domain-containing sensor histidine kinase [Deltaproteobacteria bacterium]
DLLRQVVNRELDHQRLRREARRVKDLEEELLGFSRVKAEMERLGAVESRFMLTMVHTLRVPVAVLENSLQLIRKGYVPPQEQPAFLERAEQRAQELLVILDEVLLLSRLKEGLGSALTAPVSVAEALASALPLLRQEAEARNMTLSIEDTASPVVSGKMEYIKALWAHLVNNAIRYTRPGGRITISLKGCPKEGKAIGTVSDTGIGIATEEIPRIFEEFYRTEAAKSLQETGTGLGLSIVQQIVARTGGTIEIDSNPGHGSTFCFILPLAGGGSGAAP